MLFKLSFTNPAPLESSLLQAQQQAIARATTLRQSGQSDRLQSDSIDLREGAVMSGAIEYETPAYVGFRAGCDCPLTAVVGAVPPVGFYGRKADWRLSL